jgi:hypothetical protein
MSNIQLYLTIGIPTFAVLIGILMNVVHYNSLNARLGSIDSRFNGVDSRFNSVDARFDTFEVKFDTLIGKVIDLVNRVTRIDAKLDLR